MQKPLPGSLENNRRLTIREGIDIFNGDPYAGRRVSSQANSAACFKLIAHWIKVCLVEHKRCQRIVCPYSWTDEPETWARSPSCLSSSESELLDHHPAVNPFLDAALDAAGRTVEPEANLDTSDTEISFERPLKRVKVSSPKLIARSEDSSTPSTHFQPDQVVKESNLKRLEEAGANQLRNTSLLTKRSPLSKGILCNKEHAPRRGSDGSLDDGYYQLFHRSEDLLELRDNSWRYSDVEMASKLPPLLPTRYIYVDSNPPQLCIAGPDSRGFYIALSHCWGKSRTLVTTTATLADHVKGIPLKDMPQTLRDAVIITRELGLEYLWIDSLCILQDCKEDWEKESAKMGGVYGNAFLTISAGASEDSEQGIFRPRTVPPGPPVEVRCNDSDFEPIYIDYRPGNTPFQEPQSTDARAWCFQETALSPRVLVYGKEMLGWMCDSVVDVEHGYVVEHHEDPNPPLLAPRLNPTPAENPLKDLGYPFTLYHHLREKERSFGRWASMVNAFTKRKLTHESDRLPALSGIVKELQLQTGDEYLAGLWRQNLWHELQWQVDISFADKDATWRRPATYRAPSWSWASIEGPVRINLRPSELDKAHGQVAPPADDVHLLEAKIETIGHNPYGEVSGGYLRLSTRLWKVALRPFQNTKDVNPKFWLRPEKWRDGRIMNRCREVYSLEGKRMGRCVIDMPDEREWDAAELWWVKLNVYQAGVLVTKTNGGDAFTRVGRAFPTDANSPQFPETEMVEVVLV